VSAGPGAEGEQRVRKTRPFTKVEMLTDSVLGPVAEEAEFVAILKPVT
jgi:hypothetical protein